MAQEQRGFLSSRWMTYKQAASIGGQVKKGEKGTMIIFFKPWEKGTGENDANGQEDYRKNSDVAVFYGF